MNDTLDNLSDFKERDMDLLQTLDEDNLTSFSFEGLKRRLKLHPETLSRILGRLTDQGFIKKTNDGYCLTSKAEPLLKHHSKSHNLRVLQTLLPSEISIPSLVSNLKGKWFGVHRWLGYTETKNGVTLRWITDDGGAIISAVFSSGNLNIDAKMISKNNLDVALNASHQLMSYITQLISQMGHN
jgi:hypothetical protein